MGHGIAVHENSARQRESALSDSDVLAVYAAVSGFDISTGNNDNGAYLIDVLRYMRTRGMGRQKDGRPTRSPPTQRSTIRTSTRSRRRPGCSAACMSGLGCRHRRRRSSTTPGRGLTPRTPTGRGAAMRCGCPATRRSTSR
jgi:hypothetical protein